MVVFVRIDDRLIHGQVVEGWVNFLKATGIFEGDNTSINRLRLFTWPVVPVAYTL